MQYKEPKTLAEAAEMEDKAKEERARKRLAEKRGGNDRLTEATGEVVSQELSTEDVIALIKGKSEKLVIQEKVEQGVFSKQNVMIVSASIIAVLALSGLSYAGYSYVNDTTPVKKTSKKKKVEVSDDKELSVKEISVVERLPKKEIKIPLETMKGNKKSKTINVSSAEEVIKAINEWNEENEKRSR